MSHQIDESAFRGVLPEDIEWKPFPAFPPSARLAVVVGDPSEAGPYVIRVKVPSGVKLMPHVHPEDRVYGAPVHWVVNSRPGRSMTMRLQQR
jgi:hypothetical protein